MENRTSSISSERLELIKESAQRQIERGISLESVITNLQNKGLDIDEAEELANSIYIEFVKKEEEKEKEKEVNENYCKADAPPAPFFSTIIRGFISWVIAMFTGGLIINPEVFKKKQRKQERIE